MEFLIIVSVAVVFAFGLIGALFSRYKKCPSDKILVKYGKVGKSTEGGSKSASCIHGGAAFIWPVFQSYAFLDLTPLSIEVNLTNALSKQNIRIDVPSRFTVGVSTEPGVMQNAAERLLGLKMNEIQELAKDIIFGQLRLVVATMDIEEINTDRDKFLSAVSSNVETELKKIGLRLINVNVTDINDESGYIDALGKEAAAKAINDAKRTVAEKNRDGAIGEANAHRDERVQVASANANAVEGENLSKVTIAQSLAERRVKEAEANKIAVSAEKIQNAKAMEESYQAEELAEKQRAKRDMATKEADIIVEAEIAKREKEIQAEAEAERNRRIARGEADAIYAKMEAQAKGMNEILVKQAEGFKKLVEAANGDAQQAAMLMIADKLEDLVRIQVDAIKNIEIDKVVVWEGGGSSNGQTSTSNFISGLMESIPPMNDLFKMAGLQLPEYLVKDLEEKRTEMIEEALPHVEESPVQEDIAIIEE